MTSVITSAIVAAVISHGGAKPAFDHMPRSGVPFSGQTNRGSEISGRASVVDGDTIDIHGQRFRMYGIDAPESAQACEDGRGAPYPCGRVAANALARQVEGKVVACSARDEDQYGRVVAVCTAGGVDLNGWMVRSGHAVAYKRFTRDYVGAEAQARSEGAGIWQGRFEDPGQFRQQKKQAERGYGGYGRY